MSRRDTAPPSVVRSDTEDKKRRDSQKFENARRSTDAAQDRSAKKA
jgi:hypothetical protein